MDGTGRYEVPRDNNCEGGIAFCKRTDVLDALQDVDFSAGDDERVRAAGNAGAPRWRGSHRRGAD